MRHDSPPYNLIVAALTGTAPDPGPDWDWDETMRIAAGEHVLASLCGRLPAPPDVTAFLDGIHALNHERNRQLLDELETHALLLNQAGLEPVLLKGVAYLATGVYPDPSERLLRDIDLLLSPGQALQAFDLIQATGYESCVPNPAALVQHHYPPLTRVQRVPVEIHHRLGQGDCASFLTADEIVADSVRLRLGRAIVRVPSPEHLMTHLIMHSQMHHAPQERIWPPLRAMIDLVRVDRHFTIHWDLIRARFRAHRKTTLLETHLLQVGEALGVAPPFAIPSRSVRWWYRRALWREPRLRYIDPFYTFARIVAPRIQLSRLLLRSSEGRRYVFGTPFRRSFYKKLLDGITDG
jgi:hypothetical protein